MSTRAAIHFCWEDGEIGAILYHHYDGDSVGDKLGRFFAEVIATAERAHEGRRNGSPLSHCRFDDPHYTAARFIVWAALRWREWGREMGMRDRELLLYHGVGPCMGDSPDIAYRWRVLCREREVIPELICDLSPEEGEGDG